MDQKTKNKFRSKSYIIIDQVKVAPETVILTISGYIKYEPGQFFRVALPHLGEATFAPCSSINDKKSFQLCIRATDPTTNQMISMLPGDSLDIRGPYGNAWPIGKMIGKNLILAIGGMGIVPIRSLIFELLKYKKEFKKIAIFAGFRTPNHVLFEKDFLKWKNQTDYCKVAVEKSDKQWWGETGTITEILDLYKFDEKNTIVVMCGPDIMLKYCNQVFEKKGISDKNIYVSMERRMECGIGLCQHCNIGKYLVCKDGPIFSWNKIKDEIGK